MKQIRVLPAKQEFHASLPILGSRIITIDYHSCLVDSQHCLLQMICQVGNVVAGEHLLLIISSKNFLNS